MIPYFRCYDSFSKMIDEAESDFMHPDIRHFERYSLSLCNCEWYGSASLQEACNIGRNGWKEGIEKINPLMQKFEKEFLELCPLQGTGVQKNLDIEGEYIDIDAWKSRSGPEIFATWTPTNESIVQSRTQTFLINISRQAAISPVAIMAHGAFIAALINTLELHGTRTSIYIVNSHKVRGGHKELVMSCKIKSFSEFLDPSLLTFAIAHPSMTRRICFSLLETFKDDTEMIAALMLRSYGCAKDIKLTEKYLRPIMMEAESLENTIYIPCLASNEIEWNKSNVMEQLKKVMKGPVNDE